MSTAYVAISPCPLDRHAHSTFRILHVVSYRPVAVRLGKFLATRGVASFRRSMSRIDHSRQHRAGLASRVSTRGTAAVHTSLYTFYPQGSRWVSVLRLRMVSGSFIRSAQRRRGPAEADFDRARRISEYRSKPRGCLARAVGFGHIRSRLGLGRGDDQEDSHCPMNHRHANQSATSASTTGSTDLNFLKRERKAGLRQRVGTRCSRPKIKRPCYDTSVRESGPRKSPGESGSNPR